MDRAQLIQKIKTVRELVQSLQKELHRLEAIYIGDLYQLCTHEFDKPWVFHDLNHDKNSCSICGKKVVRNRDGEIE